MRKGLFRPAFIALLSFLVLILAVGGSLSVQAQEEKPKEPLKPGPMLDQGTVDFDTPDFTLTLVRSSQTVAALRPKSATGFDFTPGDMLVERSQNGYYHLGDLDLRVRLGKAGEWKNYSTAFARKPVTMLSVSGSVVAAADLTPTFPADLPLNVQRTWAVDGGKLVLRFTLKNTSAGVIQVGALGIPMIFNNVINGRTLEQAHTACSFYDPYIGEDAGYLQVTRLNGAGPALVVVPDGKTPFEAYNPILNPPGRHQGNPSAQIFTDATPRGMTFEGFFDWMVHSQAYAENEWQKAQPWNPPTMLTLAPGESKTYGVKFLVSPSIRQIEDTLAANTRPVAVGVPGYVLPMDIDGRLFLRYDKPVKSIVVEPAGAITFSKESRTPGGWKSYSLRGKNWGRARVAITYSDGTVQAISYFVMKPAAQAVADLGNFLTTKQWFVDPKDPFHRSPSVMTYDRELNQIVTQDHRVWIAGLGDEGGSGSWLTAFMKEFGQPDKAELEKLQQFVDGPLWGHLQLSEGEQKYGVRKSLFYYEPNELPPNYYRSDVNWKTWASWNKKGSEDLGRSFNYPHIAAAHWVMYRLARNHQGLVTNHPWDWYLSNAYETTMAMMKFAPYYTAFGQMEGDVFLQILADLKREGMTAQSEALETQMRTRAERWNKEAYPFGSEMPWDSTGQEEVYAWTKYFGQQNKADVTLEAITGYMPTIPHWGYNGSARRYWDFLYAAKYSRIERQLHHYGSTINAIPVLDAYRVHPDDFYLLRIGYGGTMGSLTNIDQEGFASPAFHSFPDMLKFDPLSGDYGPNFFGHAFNTATYIVHHPEFGWLAFGGNVASEGAKLKIKPLDSFRTRVYIALSGYWFTLDSGKFEAIELNTKTGAMRIGLAAADQYTSDARLRIERPAKELQKVSLKPTAPLKIERDAYVVPLSDGTTWIELTTGK
jgi:hypothetical protein